jgi:hypothetical protein
VFNYQHDLIRIGGDSTEGGSQNIIIDSFQIFGMYWYPSPEDLCAIMEGEYHQLSSSCTSKYFQYHHKLTSIKVKPQPIVRYHLENLSFENSGVLPGYSLEQVGPGKLCTATGQYG